MVRPSCLPFSAATPGREGEGWAWRVTAHLITKEGVGQSE